MVVSQACIVTIPSMYLEGPFLECLVSTQLTNAQGGDAISRVTFCSYASLHLPFIFDLKI